MKVEKCFRYTLGIFFPIMSILQPFLSTLADVNDVIKIPESAAN